MDMMDLIFGAERGDFHLASTLPILHPTTSKTLAGHRILLAKNMCPEKVPTTKGADQERSGNRPPILLPRGSDRRSGRSAVAT